jgi:hypothetical protein
MQGHELTPAAHPPLNYPRAESPTLAAELYMPHLPAVQRPTLPILVFAVLGDKEIHDFSTRQDVVYTELCP